jgi:hypothetical protein
VRTAVAILVIVALVFLAVGAVNHAATLDLDFLAISWSGVSLFWVTVVLACVVVAAGLVGAWAARGSAVAAQHRLEKELAATYRRLREAQAAAGVAAAATEATVVATAVEEATAVAALGPPAGYEAEGSPGGAEDTPYPAADEPRDVAAEVTGVTVAVVAGDAEAEPATELAAEAGRGGAEGELTAVTVLTPAPDFGAVPVGPPDGSTAGEATADEAVIAVAPVEPEGPSEPEGSGDTGRAGPPTGDAPAEQTGDTPR